MGALKLDESNITAQLLLIHVERLNIFVCL